MQVFDTKLFAMFAYIFIAHKDIHDVLFIGTIHLGNLLTNTRVILKYVVEERKERQEELAKLIGSQSGVNFVTSDKTDAVLKDKE